MCRAELLVTSEFQSLLLLTTKKVLKGYPQLIIVVICISYQNTFT